jgi:hypothetical protein
MVSESGIPGAGSEMTEPMTGDDTANGKEAT